MVVTPGSKSLEIRGEFPPGTNTTFGVVDGGEAFTENVEVLGLSEGAVFVSPKGGEWELPPCAMGCEVRYSFALRRAAEVLNERGSAEVLGPAIQAPVSTWLLRPLAAKPGIPIALNVQPAPGETYATGVSDLRTAEVLDLPYTVFGAPVHVQLHPSLEVALVGESFAQQEEVLAWVDKSAQVVRAFYGQPPIPKVLVIVRGIVGNKVGFGSTMGMSGAAIRIDVGKNATASDLQDDWVMIHEMIHTALPELTPKHRWLEEGLATYLEPVARAQAGLLSEEQVWEEWLRRMRLGLPRAGDLGLNRTPSWGRTYWGGALFCLLADVQIRERTQNRASLGDALRAIVAKGGNVGVIWPIEQVLAVGDEATGVSVLKELYQKLALAPESPDLQELFGKLGVSLKRRQVVFDDRAPLAAVRRAILAKRVQGVQGRSR
ncbi:MAG: hypothetical protein SFV15_05880 [Polyangiaceae bacterium]|nr:hypothetical protein [Polyangiaceae bacterium]